MTPPILLDFPESFETERLVIRAPRPGDGPEMNAAVHETLEGIQTWMPWGDPPPTVEQSEEYVRSRHAAFLGRSDLGLLLFRKDTGEFVGGSGLHPREWRARSFEVGYWCRKRFEGQGYVTEAVRGIARFALDHLSANRLFIRTAVNNERSIRVAERAGFVLEGVLRNELALPGGQIVDARIYSLIPAERERLNR